LSLANTFSQPFTVSSRIYTMQVTNYQVSSLLDNTNRCLGPIKNMLLLNYSMHILPL